MNPDATTTDARTTDAPTTTTGADADAGATVPRTDSAGASRETGRALSPTSTRSGGRGGMVRTQILAELRQSLRSPANVIGTVGVPVILFAMFALPNRGQQLPGGTDVATMLIASFAAYGIVSLCIFTFGVDIAQERARGWLRRLRSTPMPMWVYFAGKIAMALVLSAIVVGLVLAAAAIADVPLSLDPVLRTVGVLLLGTIVFAPLGCALAFLAPPKAAAAIGNLVFLPLSFCSGFFTPLASLPDVLQQLAPWLPTYHFGRLVWSQIAPAADVQALTGESVDGLAVHVAVVVAAMVVGTALAAWGFVRDGRRERA